MTLRIAWATCAIATLGWMGCQQSESDVSDHSIAGDDRTCEVVASRPVAWTESTELGTPEAAFSGMQGTCEAPFAWDGKGWDGTLVVTPEKGESVVTATVVLDQASGRLVERKPSGSGLPVSCPTILEIDAAVTLETPDGWLAREQPVTLQTSNDGEEENIDFTLSEAEFGNLVSVTPADPNAVVTMHMRIMDPSLGCAGEVALTYKLTYGSGTDIREQPIFASWSNSRCKMGEFGVDLAEPYQDVDLLAVVAEAFGDKTFSATWEDGGATTMSLSATVTANEVCGEHAGEMDVVVVPVEIAASTEDGRVDGFTGPGTVRASFWGGDLAELQLWISKEESCSTTEDVLSYTTAKCADVQGITMQLGFNRYYASAGPDGGRLEIYVYSRGSTGPGGPADRVDRLELSP